ncbi:PREDICTED: uncharacterized protein LOC104700767 isoform X2 [Camelina sativa]|uniref:Uncharacterized protein LOC104700767 isoform X2 n=1 Tax=Camelina sativa TaxID=90675 RepID=A0ABM1Q8N1_CAMSA|nr:PREDICTED: uncharacterized protein LOC104700767 isoform X2 [Camelina sativa]
MAPCDKNPSKCGGDGDDDLKTKKYLFKQKFPTFKKKAIELSVLCGNSVGFICHGPDNDLHVWPDPQDNPQALPEIVGKFNSLSDHMRMSHASDLFDLPHLKGLSNEELLRHLAKLNSQSVGIKQKKMSLLTKRGISKKPPNDDHLRVSDNNAAAIISNRKEAAALSDDQLGFRDHETVNNLGSSAAASKVCSVSDSSLHNPPLTLGLSCGDYSPVDPLPATDHMNPRCENQVIPSHQQNQSLLRSSSPSKSCGDDDDDDDDLKRAKRNFFKQIFPTFKKKATELSVLCGNSVGFICYGPDNDLHVWPEPEENPQAIPEIVAKFNGLSDLKRKNHASDLYGLPMLKGLSGDELRNHLVNLDSHLLGIKQKKMSIIGRSSSTHKPRDAGVSDSSVLNPLTLGLSCGDYYPVDSMPATVIPSDLQNQSELGSSSLSLEMAPCDNDPNKFGGGCEKEVIPSDQQNQSELRLSSLSLEMASYDDDDDDDGVSDSSMLDSSGSSGGDSLPMDLIPTTTYSLEVCANEGASDELSRIDLHFASTLFPG